MKHKSLLLVFVLLLSMLSVNAQSDCTARGNIMFTVDKPYFTPGETITGKIKIINNNKIDSPATYSLRLLKGSYSPWSLTESRTVPPGNSTYELYQIFRVSVPRDSETGRWVIQLNGALDNCIWTNNEPFYVVSCTDGILNGNEEGIDCGGTCSQQCKAEAKQATTTTIQSSGASSYFTQFIPYQLPKNFFLYLAIIVLLLMIIMGSSVIYWRRRARFSKFY